MGWLVVIAIFAGLAFIGWLPDFLADRRNKARQQESEARRIDFNTKVDQIFSERRDFNNSFQQFNAVIDKFIEDIANDKAPSESQSEDSVKVITQPKDGDFIGKCPKCKTNNLVLRGGSKSGYIKCQNYPRCEYMRTYSDLTKTFQIKKEELFRKDLDRAYR